LYLGPSHTFVLGSDTSSPVNPANVNGIPNVVYGSPSNAYNQPSVNVNNMNPPLNGMVSPYNIDGMDASANGIVGTRQQQQMVGATTEVKVTNNGVRGGLRKTWVMTGVICAIAPLILGLAA
jgi:hypothetical protein